MAPVPVVFGVRLHSSSCLPSLPNAVIFREPPAGPLASAICTGSGSSEAGGSPAPAGAAPAAAGAAPAGISDEVETVLAEIRKAGEETLEDFRDRVARALDELGEVGERGRKSLSDVEEAVRENPWAALGIAAGAALLAGLLLSLRR